MTLPPLTAAERLKLRELCERATSGPWESEAAATRAGALHRVTYKAAGMNRGAIFIVAEMHGTEGNDRSNAAFIAASREAVPRLLDEVERLRQLVLEACRMAHDRTTIIGDGQYGRINQIRAEVGEP